MAKSELLSLTAWYTEQGLAMKLTSYPPVIYSWLNIIYFVYLFFTLDLYCNHSGCYFIFHSAALWSSMLTGSIHGLICRSVTGWCTKLLLLGMLHHSWFPLKKINLKCLTLKQIRVLVWCAKIPGYKEKTTTSCSCFSTQSTFQRKLIYCPCFWMMLLSRCRLNNDTAVYRSACGRTDWIRFCDVFFCVCCVLEQQNNLKGFASNMILLNLFTSDSGYCFCFYFTEAA